ncbi:MAG: DUF6962 family protein, partial [Candidatus Binatia bacterium]
MTEPDVTLTDYGLAIECAVFSFLLYFHGDRAAPTRSWFILFFCSIGVATLAGGTVHGFFLDPETIGYRILWPLTLVAGGLAALATWAIAARLWLSEKTARRLITLAMVEFVAYCAAVLLYSQEFYIAIANYLPPTLLLLMIFHKLYRHMRIRELRSGTIGLVLTFVAAGVQQGRIALHPVYFNHNAVYHVIQAVALFMIFRAAHW